MGKFFGTYNRSLDDKRRLQIPSKLIDKLPARFFAIKGFDGCISAYVEEDFSLFLEKLDKLSFFLKDERDFYRSVTSSVKELEVDSHGRITIDRDLSEIHKIDHDVTVLGVGDHFEIWDRAAYEEYKSSIDDEFENISERIWKNNG